MTMFFKENKRLPASSLHKKHCIDGLDRLSDAFNNLDSNNNVLSQGICAHRRPHIEEQGLHV